MKNNARIFVSLVLAATLFLFIGRTVITAQSQQIPLPSAGLTPESPLYFFDKLGESLQRLLTFNPEAKARLEIAFAAERISEIKDILESKGVQAKGIEVAQNILNRNLTQITSILNKQRSEGEDVNALAKELNEEFAGPKTVLEQTFKEQKQMLEDKEDELKTKIKAARRVGDTTQVGVFMKDLAELKAKEELLEQKGDEQKKDLDERKDAIEEYMSAKEGAEKKIRESEKDKAEIVDEIKKEGLVIPAKAFAQFDNLLTQAKTAFGKGDYAKAKQLAKQAEKSFEYVDKNVEKFKNAKENEQELKEEAKDQQKETEDKLKEASKDAREKIREEIKQQEVELKEKQEKAEEDIKNAEEKLERQETEKEKD
ncbi:MAG: DUF5667 domain-containing protein [Patescibacteria group bacterium]